MPSSESQSGVKREYTYDSADRVTETAVTLNNKTFKTTMRYDTEYGRPLSMAYPSGLVLGYEYNNLGYLTREFNAASNYTYRTVSAQDAFGNITDAKLGNNLTYTAAYSAKTGQMTAVAAGTLHAHSYTYDAFGNLHTQNNGVATINVTETYAYDKLHRLKTVSNSEVPELEVSYDYDKVGNFTYKSDYSVVGQNAYVYTSGTNRVQSVALPGSKTASFGYDNKGNLTHRNGSQEVTYNAFNKPVTINRNGASLTFTYGADLMRYKQVDTTDGTTTTTYYIDKHYERVVVSGGGSTSQDYERNYISDIAIVRTNKSGSSPALRYTLKDRLGSATTLVNEHNAVVARRHFDAFGKPKGGDWQVAGNGRLAGNIFDSDLFSQRGFTDHEHLDSAELIHMNGRVYDYNLGRFMSVDPLIQGVGNSQGINPYAYVMNNPLSFTDPSGYSAEDTKPDLVEDATLDGATQIEVNSKTGIATVTYSNGTQASVDAVKATAGPSGSMDIMGQGGIAKQGGAGGKEGRAQQPDQSSGSLSGDIQAAANDGIQSVGESFGSSDRQKDAVNAEYTNIEYDEFGNVVAAQITCDSSCISSARKEDIGVKWTQHELQMSVMRTSYANSQRAVADTIVDVVEIASYAFVGLELMTYSAARWAFLKGSDKIAYFMLYGDILTLANGGSTAVVKDAIVVHMYKSAKSLTPKMTLKAKPGKPVVKDGKFVVE